MDNQQTHQQLHSPAAARAFAVRSLLIVTLGVSLGAPSEAAISGRVIVAGSGLPGTPIAGARVHIQADITSPVVTTAANGTFVLPVSPAGEVTVTAAVPYDVDAAVNYNTGGETAEDGDLGVVIALEAIPLADNANYTPIKAAVPGGCGDCHSEQLDQWSMSAHARAGTDVWVRDLYSGDGTAGGGAGYVFTEVNPGQTGYCATCHTPVAEAHAPGTVFFDQVTGTAELEGVTCTACHQLDHVDATNLRALHLVGKASFRFPLAGVGGSATHEYVWGPLDDVTYPFMKAAHAPLFTSSLMCASCHEYDNPTTGAPGQHTYSEWAASSYAIAGSGFRSCQDCHMPPAVEAGPIADPVLPPVPPLRPGSQRNSHAFVGATPTTLSGAIELSSSADASAGVVEVVASVTNAGAGHSFPTGVSIRNALLVIEADVDGVPLTRRDGPTVPWWADDEVPGVQAGDYAGLPGTGFAKILSGPIDGKRVAPVLFIDADQVDEDSLLLAGQTRNVVVRLELPPGAEVGQQLTVRVRLLYRRAFRALAVTKGWSTTPENTPVEVEVASDVHSSTLDHAALVLFEDGFESGTVIWDGP